MFSPELIDIEVLFSPEFIGMMVVFGTELIDVRVFVSPDFIGLAVMFSPYLITMGFLNTYCRLDVAGCSYLFS